MIVTFIRLFRIIYKAYKSTRRFSLLLWYAGLETFHVLNTTADTQFLIHIFYLTPKV